MCVYVYVSVSCVPFQEVNRYCLKPVHGLYGLNDCPSVEGIYSLTGINNSARNHTLHFNMVWVSSSFVLKFASPALKNVGLIFPSFILDCSFWNFK